MRNKSANQIADELIPDSQIKMAGSDSDRERSLIKEFVMRFETEESKDPNEMLKFFHELAGKYVLNSEERGQASNELKQQGYDIPLFLR